MSQKGGSSARASSVISGCSTYEAEISLEASNDFEKPRMGLGSTSNENIALRRNYREMELLWKTQKILGNEQVYILKLLDLHEKSIQVNYKRLTKRVKKIKSHLTNEEIKEMENDLRKKEFADKYRMLLHNQDAPEPTGCDTDGSQSAQTNFSEHSAIGLESKMTKNHKKLEVIQEEPADKKSAKAQRSFNDSESLRNKDNCGSNENEMATYKRKESITSIRSQTSYPRTSSIDKISTKQRPKTTPNLETDNSEAMKDLIPTLDDLLDQLHNIKPQQFYENQRKLKLYEIRLLEEELEEKKEDLFKAVDQIINWDKPTQPETEEEEKKEEEKPRQRKTSFMRSVLRNFSMELMMKTMQYGWTDLGQCRYLRNRGGDDHEADTSGANTLAKDTMKIRLDCTSVSPESPQDGATVQRTEPGFDENGKMIRTADLLGLKQED